MKSQLEPFKSDTTGWEEVRLPKGAEVRRIFIWGNGKATIGSVQMFDINGKMLLEAGNKMSNDL